jgi:hypothetical protein
MPFFGMPKATVYKDPAAVPRHKAAEMRKRNEDLEITERRLCDSIEASAAHKKRFKIDKWDFVCPGSSPEEQDLVQRIYDKLSTNPRVKKPIDRAKYDIIVRAGFHDSLPATYCQFIAALGSKQKIIYVRQVTYEVHTAKLTVWTGHDRGTFLRRRQNNATGVGRSPE